MANIKLVQPVTKDDVRAILARRCPDLALGTAGAMITAAQTSWVAAMVTVNRRTVTVMPGVRSMGMLLLSLLILVTGIGLIIYAVTLMPRQRDVARRVEGILSEELAAPRVAAAG